jgi:hypothetical protein
VLRLRKGDTILVTLFSNDKFRGKVDEILPTGICLVTKQGSMVIPKENVRKVAHVGKPGVNALGGGLMVGGVLLAVTAETAGTVRDANQLSQGQISGSTGKHNLGLELAGILIATGGFAVLVFGGRPRTIYEAKAPPTQASNN